MSTFLFITSTKLMVIKLSLHSVNIYNMCRPVCLSSLSIKLLHV